LKKNTHYEIPSIAKNKHLRQDVLDVTIHEPIVKSNTFKKRIVNSIFEDKEVRSALKMLSKV